MTKNNKNLREDLTPEQFHVTQEKGTEMPSKVIQQIGARL